MSLRVLEPGLQTLVVDFGRPNYRSLGVPVGGAADRSSLAIANALVGNPPDAAALEICLAGPTLEAQAELGCVIYGAPFFITVVKKGGSDQTFSARKTFTLNPGDQLQIGSTPIGIRAYLAIRGGIQTEQILESRSSLEPIQAGIDLPCLTGRIHARFFSQEKLGFGSLAENCSLRILDGLQADWFSWNQFTGQELAVTSSSNRMGLRLAGKPLTMPERELVSEPVCPGTVQVTRDGQCIVLGVDGQTIGGYPKIAQVISADLDCLGQLRPGDRIRFVRVTLDEAAKINRDRQRELNAWILRLRTALGTF
jgi:5-oxoprolinase (ATP-hydrolysing) subunit C